MSGASTTRPADAHDAEGQCWFPDRSLGAPCVCDELDVAADLAFGQESEAT